jgi:putative phosphoesterase
MVFFDLRSPNDSEASTTSFMLAIARRPVFLLLHNLKELDLDPAAAGIDVVVSGHSHRPKIETVGGVLYFNPGSAGPRRFTLPIALATLELTGDALRPFIHHIGKMPSRK